MDSKLNILRSHEGAVVTFLLNDGKGNVVDSIMMEEIRQGLVELERDAAVKLLVFQGAGKHFSFGASVQEHLPAQAGDMIRSFHALFKQLQQIALPTLALVSGQCLGGGMELALACNFIHADETAKFGQPEIILGVFPPPASLLLPLKIGASRAEDILLTGRTVGAPEAHGLGFVQKVYTDQEAMKEGTEAFIQQNFLPRSASSLRYAVRAARTVTDFFLLSKLDELEKLYVQGLMETSDAVEGIQAFLEKRKPEWKNQ